MKTGDLIEVDYTADFKSSIIREFIGMTSTNKFLCWTLNKEYAVVLDYGREISKFKELKECETLGARFECKSSRSEWGDIGEPGPLWLDGAEYRIKDDITPEQFKKHYKEIIAWWNGAEIEFRDMKGDRKWEYNPRQDALTWRLDHQYRVKKPKTKTVYEWVYKPGNYWQVYHRLITEEEAKEFFTCRYQKTGRNWEVLDD